MISTVHTCKMVETTSRKTKRLKPELSIDYNKKMYGVDIVDHNISNYRIERSRGKTLC